MMAYSKYIKWNNGQDEMFFMGQGLWNDCGIEMFLRIQHSATRTSEANIKIDNPIRGYSL